MLATKEYQTIDVRSFLPMPCPCCGQSVAVPSLEIIVENYGISDLQARILRTVWKGKGRPVRTNEIFDAMYADDPDGGPSDGAMHRAIKWSLLRLREKLKGSGVSIESVGYRRGYRLVMKENG